MSTAALYKRVLLLNGSWEPRDIITVKRAIGMLMGGQAEPIDGRQVDDLLQAAKDVCGGVAAQLTTGSGLVFVVPNIIKLKYYVNVPRPSVVWSRHNVFKRDDFTCGYCGCQIGSKKELPSGEIVEVTFDNLTIDHIKPQAHGGKSTWVNTVTACYWCNNMKADRLPHQAGMKLQINPRRPRCNGFIIGSKYPKEWRVFIETN